MNYRQLVEQYQEDLIEDLKGLLAIESIKGESTPDAPVGEGPKAALDFMLELGARDGMTTKSVENLAGHIEYGKGAEIFGVLGHVDVVPASGEWDTPPFEPTIQDGYIIARGVQDDKGPTMAAYYAMKILKDQGHEFNKRLRLIIGTDEESDWECTRAYFKHEAMPDAGFAPDAAFPLIHGEKGISTFNLIQDYKETTENVSGIELISFDSGEALNVVPDTAECKLKGQNLADVKERFEHYLKSESENGHASISQDELTLYIEGKSAHGSTPTKGEHAGHKLLKFLKDIELDSQAQHFVEVMNKYVVDNLDGTAYDLFATHDEMGETTINSGKITYQASSGGEVGVNYRYPFGVDFDEKIEVLKSLMTESHFKVTNASGMPPHYVDSNDPLITLLVDAYRNHVDDDREPFTIGGGTYARVLDKGVAFGAMFKDSVDTMHQKNERMKVEELITVTTIYLEALHRIICKDEI